ncbi:MAG: ammonium transporter [Spirochaetales bacterium]|nr:ammonium transporter [Spirochaetales bacterium]
METLDGLSILRQETDLLWMCLSAFLVFLMQAGFALVEAGFTRTKNVVNILMKNISDFLFGTLAYFFLGFSLMYGPSLIAGLGPGMPAVATALIDVQGKPDSWNYGFFLFQAVFCGTAATIASGAMAERTRFPAYLIASVCISGFIYPVFGSLSWNSLFDSTNQGLLVRLGFIDFAGSTVVHAIGGWLALAGALVLGPRLGKYREDGKVSPIFGHNLSLATIGVFLLWFGWFGFNPGSTTSVGKGSFAIVAVMTALASATGGMAALFVSWLLFKRPDITMVLNGVLAGLVAITAPCYDVDTTGALIIGAVAGVLVVFSVIFFDLIRVDDPVGAISVHGVCGLWGTLAVGLFASPEFGSGTAGLFYGGGMALLGVQALGSAIAFVWALGAGLLLMLGLKYTVGLRVSREEEIEGLDIIEHGNEAYPEKFS